MSPLLEIVLFVWFYCSVLVLSAYDSSPLQFHPNGRILQLEYAKDATKKGGPVAGLRCADGVILVAAKRLPFSKFQAKPIRKLFRVDDHIVIGATGLLFDANAMADVAERLCRNYKSIYDSPIPLENLCDELATIFHRQTKSASSRPLGISLLVAGWDDEFGPQLYEVDPEGSVTAWNAASVGKGADKVMDALSDCFADQSLSSDKTVAASWPRFRAILQRHLPHTPRELTEDFDFTSKSSHGLPVAVDSSATPRPRADERDIGDHGDDDDETKEKEDIRSPNNNRKKIFNNSNRGDGDSYADSMADNGKDESVVGKGVEASITTTGDSDDNIDGALGGDASSSTRNNTTADLPGNDVEPSDSKSAAAAKPASATGGLFNDDSTTPQWDLEVLTIMRTSDKRLSWSTIE